MNKAINYMLLFSIFFSIIGRFTEEFTIILIILLLVKMLKQRKNVQLMLIFFITLIIIYNFRISSQYFYMNLDTLNLNSNKFYAIRLIEFFIITSIFSDRNIAQQVYLFFKKHIRLVISEIILCESIILIYLFTGKGFDERWGMKVFQGTYLSPHPYAYSLIVMVVVIEFIIMETKNNKFLVLYIIPLFTSLLTGARAPLICMVTLFFTIRFLKEKLKFKKYIDIKKLIISIFGLIIVVLLSKYIIHFIINSSIVDKFIDTSKAGNISNSRFEFWGNLINEYNTNFDFLNKLFGHGINYTALINKLTINSAIWAHSDFIDILISYGAIILVLYIIFYLNFFIKWLKNIKNKKLPIIIFISIIALSSFNGIINYIGFIPIFIYLSIFFESILNYKRI